jgi:hypothetical protein
VRGSLANFIETSTTAFELQDALGTGDMGISRLTHAAHAFAHLRIAKHVTVIGARLTTNLLGLNFGWVGFAPTGRLTRFPEAIRVTPFPLDQPCLVTPCTAP